MQRELTLKLAAEDKQIVFAEVYLPDVPDADNDIMSAEDIEKMAYKFMREQKTDRIDVQHSNKLDHGAHVVESFIARKGDPHFIEGAWVVGIHVPNKDTWAKIKKGELNGFSMEAMVTRQDTQIEVEIPAVITGLTHKSDDGHEHEFFVSYAEDGSFVGGKTSTVNGHSHAIHRGTITEKVDGHNHRFNYIDKWERK